MFFFFKQKTAYEIKYGLVGSEMCIRDSIVDKPVQIQRLVERPIVNIVDKITDKPVEVLRLVEKLVVSIVCLLYTSDAADERSSVDLGGRRIIKKKKKDDTEMQRDGTRQTHNV